MSRRVFVFALLMAPVLLAQEPAAPLQFNVPYRCKDGNTYIVSRCAPAGRGEFCFYEQIQNGVSLGEGYTTRPQMEARVKACEVQRPAAASSATKPAAALNPAYLKEMPPADRVKREIQGSDAMDTAGRQAGAFFELREIIYTLALSQRRDRNSVTADEKRLADGYYADSYYALEPFEKTLSATPAGTQKLNALRRYSGDPAILEEVLKRFFSPSFNAMYAQTDAIFAARHDEFLRAQADAEKAAAANEAAAATRAQEQRDVARCIESGRNPLTCTGDALGQALTQLVGTVAPSLAQPLAPGLRLNGQYRGGDFTVSFVNDAAVISCGALVPASHAYAVDQKNGRVVVTVENQPSPFAFDYAGDTRAIRGPGPTDVAGKVQIGTRTLTRYDSMGIGTPVSTEPVYEPRTIRCNVGSMPSGGPARAADLADLPFLGDAAKQLSGVREFQVVAGLRMTGVYEGSSGFAVEFNGDQSVMVGCRDAVVARDYTVELKGAVAAVNVQHGSVPFTLTVRPDGTLAGSGTVDVAGRVITGRDDNGNLRFAPKSDRCAVGILTPRKAKTP